MVETETFAVFHFFPEGFVPFIHNKEGVQITGVSILITFADIAGFFLFRYPHADRVGAFRIFPEFIHQG